MKILKIIVDELPESCLDCTNLHCPLPLARSKTQATDKVLKKYTTKRHEDCILEVEEIVLGRIEKLCINCGHCMILEENDLYCVEHQKVVQEDETCEEFN